MNSKIRSLRDAAELGRTGIIVSRVGFGVHPLGPTRRNLSVEEGAALMRYAYEQGIRFFDTAQFYKTYHYLRKGLEEIQRSPLYENPPVISSKSLACTKEEMAEAIEEALEALGRSCIDVFLLHQAAPGFLEERSGAYEALKEAKKAGKVRAIGLSTHHQDVASIAADIDDLDVVFALYNCAGLGIRCGSEAGSAAGMELALRRCLMRGKGVYLMKVFGGGNLTTEYRKAARHVFVEKENLFSSAMIGFTSKEEIDDLGRLLGDCMPLDYNPKMDGKKLHVDREDCMGCGTCVRICSSGAMHYSPLDGLAEIDYDKCVSCSYCAIACPERAIVLW